MPAWGASSVRAAAVVALLAASSAPASWRRDLRAAEARDAALYRPVRAPAAPLTPQQLAPQNLSLTGYWVSVVNEDWRWRMVTPPQGRLRQPAAEPRGLRRRQPVDAGAGRIVPGLRHGRADADAAAHPRDVAGSADPEDRDRRRPADAAALLRRPKAPTTASAQGSSVAQWESPARGRGGQGGGGGGRGGPPPPPSAPQFGT